MAFDSTRVGFLLCILSILIIYTICTQEEFVSIECCAQSANTEPSTGISWTSDESFPLIQGKCIPFEPPVSNDTSYKQVRIFKSDHGSRWCYNLSTISGHDYLIRGTFLHGPSVQTLPDTFFNVSISTTSIAQVNNSIDPFEVEGVFRATNHNVDFCLVTGNGCPFLSKLELRPLSNFSYVNGDPSAILKLVARVDLGSKKEIRYPTDSSDRIWTIDASFNAIPSNVTIYGANPSVPIEVLQTAVTNTEHLQFIHDGLEAGHYDYLVFLYFAELNLSIKTGQRVFDIYINGKKESENFDILQNGSTSNYREIVKMVKANGLLNISLIKVSTDVVGLDPICNAYEIFQVHKRVAGTVQQDVDAIVEVRDALLVENAKNEVLVSLSGDPCIPSPWKGLSCGPASGTPSFVITKLNLSSQRLRGPLPTIISELKELTEINLQNNEFTGTIPESFSTLQHLKNLSFGCNPQLDKQLPPGLSNRSNLNTESGDCGDQSSSSNQAQRNTVIIGTIMGGSVLVTIAVGVIFSCFYRCARHPNVVKHAMTKNAVFSMPSMDDIELKPICIQDFSLRCIETATSKYKTMIGEGGFGAVYRGNLPHGQEVAVKVRSATSTQGTREFENELNLLSAIRHENLVPLLGYCSENDQQILVYPFMSNGSLQDRLYGEASKRKPLDWQTRLSVALGAARGLLYLHTFAGRCVIHRDVKSSNILLDHSMCAKVADFGFSKYAPQEGDSAASLEVRGTAGYLDPEYYSTQQLSAKSDVFSFGVVLLEIISGREPLNIHRPRNEWSLVEWAKPFIKESRIEEIVDPNIKAGYHAEAMWRVVEVALGCIEPFSTYRPCMADIVRELEDALIIENNASEYMKSIESIGGSNRFLSIERKILAVIPTPSEPSPIFSQTMAPPQPR
ncbi:nodulation receptor kinase-like [Magnolia sinica]|uniref:nodulation receptor kinase-like n=1 Tax=Magnolia sinica TaxID=86752 RepID=UPI00265B5E0B|nr:nodulation receptor kinase-like [Magnolia sinica]